MKKVPLCVDLDGTLVYNDTVQESIITLLKKNCLYLFLVLFWSLNGHAHVKRKIIERIKFDPSTLQYNQAMIDYIKAERAKGVKTVLVTASDQRIADSVANYLGIFDQAIGSDGIRSYAGRYKRAKLNKEFPETGYTYAGNSKVDLAVWPDSKEIVIVSSAKSLLKKVKKFNKNVISFPGVKFTYKDIPTYLHMKWWWLSSIVFLCFLYEPINGYLVKATIGAFLVFSLVTSALGIFNDVFSIERHRKKIKSKHTNLISSGKVSVLDAVLDAMWLLIIAAFCLPFYPEYFIKLVAVYLGVGLAFILIRN